VPPGSFVRAAGGAVHHLDTRQPAARICRRRSGVCAGTIESRNGSATLTPNP
jgi:hypothetical protein